MIRNKQDFWAGALYFGAGVFFAGFATQYSMGTAAKMGPGYFPFWLGLLLCGIGAYVALNGLRKTAEVNEVEPFDWKTILTILGAVVAFGLLLQPMGLYIALLALIIISAFASHEFSWKGTLLNAVVLIALCYVMFVYALKLQFPLYPQFLGL
jgi:Tripartite tricarboxylate transporter TctB family